MTSKQRCSLRRKLRKQGKSEEEIQTIINNTPTAQQREARKELSIKRGQKNARRRYAENK
ncbi:TPA: hypothetical protein ACX6PX_001454 [Photobacterium damselae]|nr:hypothetical protein Vca1114GL_04733 [Vibrio campbellii]